MNKTLRGTFRRPHEDDDFGRPSRDAISSSRFSKLVFAGAGAGGALRLGARGARRGGGSGATGGALRSRARRAGAARLPAAAPSRRDSGPRSRPPERRRGWRRRGRRRGMTRSGARAAAPSASAWRDGRGINGSLRGMRGGSGSALSGRGFGARLESAVQAAVRGRPIGGSGPAHRFRRKAGERLGATLRRGHGLAAAPDGALHRQRRDGPGVAAAPASAARHDRTQRRRSAQAVSGSGAIRGGASAALAGRCGSCIPAGGGADDIRFDHDVARAADHQEMFDIVAPDQHQPAAAIHGGGIDHGQPRHASAIACWRRGGCSQIGGPARRQRRSGRARPRTRR